MKFCPKCGGLMIPTKKDGKEMLRCTKCGYEMLLSEKEKKEYSVKESRDKSNRVLTTSIVSDKEGRNLSEELQQEREEYYKEVGLELLREEFEGNEEESGEE
ncbi:DNA-directed RNA polymerase subunit M [Sulfolobus sp. A20]|uniref:RPA12/RPB9/RPC11 RNA polymerase family protein n=1 Tax=Sulfolobaceae TaxID=118883 RepID=UPI000845FF3F|nr:MULTISPECIES: RPA12/RPB9/RPC11 RNA polymerase family protein [unclassified Sulfolobus]TRM76476.1 DNA-directed RNA polymerase subunit M [Sulfolobus sp. E5]TRM76711.1 DNA-directed RNA polymerase subunit M [Sulfolobus sp. A20-N-F8]TRM76909.1 DNA-directed RNA polymerase subunit M [Sulfolobus sp. B5]TRM82761.1 DNA-directed RNA polymerase subunit M [Sulfolobus sp. A20-N-F6]TRM87754.1 DNA-directed RNA polymerase subunit M [Sulfolobus sp. C3]TRM93362.1 DNA-directed RNA polymerase subunit M [Sulfol